MNKTLFGGVGFLARTSVIALLKPWGFLAMVLIASYFGFDLALQLPICFEVGALSGGLVSSTPE